MTKPRSSTASHSHGLPVAVVILAAIVVPLVMSSVMLVDRIGEIRQAQLDLGTLRQSGADYVGISQARASLAKERLATGALLATESYNINPQLAMQVTGVDIEAAAAESIASVDNLLGEVDQSLLEHPALRDRQDADGSIFTFYPLMEAADELLADRQAMERQRLRSTIASFDGVAGLDRLADQLEVTTEMQLSTARLADTYLALKLQLDGWDPTDEALRFQTAWFEFLRAERELDRARGAALGEDPSVAALRTRFQETAVGVADSGAESVALPVGTNLLQGLLPLQSYFREFIAGFEKYAAATDSAAARYQRTVNTAEDGLRREIAVSYGALCLLAIAVVGALWFTSKQVVLPLRRLAPQIHRLRDGESGVNIETSGAMEIQHAAEAINEAAATMADVERQSKVLASGSLAELAELAPGGSNEKAAMGASMRKSLEELSAVMREREELRQQLEHAAFHDVLTGLANRRGFRIQLDQAMGQAAEGNNGSGTITALYLDLDRFKSVNDSYGHAAGDALLSEVADRLSTTVRSSDVIGRMGGDEFLIVTFDGADRSGRNLASAIKSVIEVPYHLDGRSFTVGASVGYHTASSETPIDLLIRCADAAAYYAKANLSDDAVAYTESIGAWMDGKSQPSAANT